MHGTPPTPLESIALGNLSPIDAFLPSIALRVQVSATCYANNLSTGTATFLPGAQLPYHTHPFSEAVTVLSGEATIAVCGRTYRLAPCDCIHIPRGTAHMVANNTDKDLIAHWAFASSEPTRDPVLDTFPVLDRGWNNPDPADAETIRRFASAEVYELSPGALFRDLFARRYGSQGICGGYGRFEPGASLPCHIHQFDESITIVEGEAACIVEGRQYSLSNNAAAFVPEGRPHRFINRSDQTMAMIWVYAGDEPERTLVDAGYCSGALIWPGQP